MFILYLRLCEFCHYNHWSQVKGYMLSLITNSCCLYRVDNNSETNANVYQKQCLQNVAMAIDIIAGLTLIAVGCSTNNIYLVLGGGLQLWPLMSWITMSLFSCKERLGADTFYLKFRPCGSPDPSNEVKQI